MRIVLTGSSWGIGRALADRLLAAGHDVWGLARSDQSRFAEESRGHFRAARCDVTEFAQVDEVAREVAGQWDHLDALVTCAGIQGAIGPVRTVDPERWSATVRTNLDGTLHAFRAFFLLLARAPRRAKIVCFSGGGAAAPRPNFAAYGASKAGVVRLVETIAHEERDTRVDINAVAPGAIPTRLTEEIIALGPQVVGADEHAAAVRVWEAGRASLDRALDLVEWLLSPESDGISGRLISAAWDPWKEFSRVRADLSGSDIYTLRRIVPEDRGKSWNVK